MEEDHTPPSGEEVRAELSAAKTDDLPDSVFAYIESGGSKDDEDKTVPRSLRHFPIQDEAHVRAALARAGQSPFGDKALPKIKAAAKKFGIDVADTADDAESKSASAPTASRTRKPRHRAVPLSPEVRMFHGEDGLEIREADREGNHVTIRGALVVYNAPYSVIDALGQFEERMAPGVATDVLDGDTRYLYNHRGMVLARSAAGTLTFEDSPRALWTNATVDIRNTDANNLVVAVERGDVTSMSVGFVCGDDEWNAQGDERVVKRFAAMPDASAVSFPCSPTTSLEIAQRMAQDLSSESRARVRKLYIDLQAANLRAGKVLSGQNQDQITQATKLLHGVLLSGGVDPAALVESGESGVETDDLEDASGVGDGADSNDEGTSVEDPDGSGVRQEDPGDGIRGDEGRDAPTSADWSVEAGLDSAKVALARVKAEQLKDPDNDTDPDDEAVMACINDAEAAIDKAIAAQAKDAAREPVPETKTSRALWIRAEARKLRVL